MAGSVMKSKIKSYKKLDAVCDFDPSNMHPSMAYMVGVTYLMGPHTTPMSRKAYKFILVAAKKDFKGMPKYYPPFMVATMLDSGQLGTVNKKEANEWFKRSCDNGYAEGCRKFANRAYHVTLGLDIEKSHHLSMEYYEKAYALGNKSELSNLASLYLVKKNYYKGTQLLLEGAKNGSVVAADNLGDFYRDGTFLPQSYKKAFEYLDKAAAAGYAKAQYNIAWSYLRGEGTEKNEAIAKDYFVKAGDQGDVRAVLAIDYLSSGLFEDSKSLVSPEDIFQFDIYKAHPDIKTKNQEFGNSLKDFIIQIALANRSWQGYTKAAFSYINSYNDWESGCKLLKMVYEEASFSFYYNELLSDCFKRGTTSTPRDLNLAFELISDSLGLVRKQNSDSWLEIYNKKEKLLLAKDKEVKGLELRESSGFVSIIENSDNAIHIRIDGDFDNETLVNKVHELTKDKTNVKVNLNSNGGFLEVGLKLGKLFQKLNATVIVDQGDGCYSSCAFSFLGGSRRRVGEFATIGFHRPYLPGNYRIKGSEYTDILEVISQYLDTTNVDKDLFKLFLREGPGSLFIPNKNIASVLNITT